MDSESEDMESIEERAKKLSELTGREYEDVLTDLLDDGKLNNSHIDDEPTDLVEQLKGAAELIATVQNISKDIQDNSVLNGGDNETVVEVKTTLEGDIVDRAIESVQRKAENIRKIVLIIAPIMLLLTGGVGLDYFMGDDDGEIRIGMMIITKFGDAPPLMLKIICLMQHMMMGHVGGMIITEGGGPPHQNCNWEWNDNSYINDEYPDSLFVSASFSSFQCPHEMYGDFSMALIKEGQVYDTEEDYQMTFYENQDLGHEFSDLEEGTYRLSFHYHDLNSKSDWNWDSPRTYEIENPAECSAFLQNQNAFIDEDDAEQDAVKLSVDVAIPSEVGDACDSHQFEITEVVCG